MIPPPSDSCYYGASIRFCPIFNEDKVMIGCKHRSGNNKETLFKIAMAKNMKKFILSNGVSLQTNGLKKMGVRELTSGGDAVLGSSNGAWIVIFRNIHNYTQEYQELDRPRGSRFFGLKWIRKHQLLLVLLSGMNIFYAIPSAQPPLLVGYRIKCKAMNALYVKGSVLSIQFAFNMKLEKVHTTREVRLDNSHKGNLLTRWYKSSSHRYVYVDILT
jgi:hypothetical protein